MSKSVEWLWEIVWWLVKASWNWKLNSLSNAGHYNECEHKWIKKWKRLNLCKFSGKHGGLASHEFSSKWVGKYRYQQRHWDILFFSMRIFHDYLQSDWQVFKSCILKHVLFNARHLAAVFCFNTCFILQGFVDLNNAGLFEGSFF